MLCCLVQYKGNCIYSNFSVIFHQTHKSYKWVMPQNELSFFILCRKLQYTFLGNSENGSHLCWWSILCILPCRLIQCQCTMFPISFHLSPSTIHTLHHGHACMLWISLPKWLHNAGTNQFLETVDNVRMDKKILILTL